MSIKKQYWKVSKAAIIYRAKELRCIPEETARYMYVTLGRNGERKNEAVQVPMDSPKIVRMMYDLHGTELDYSPKEMSDIVGLVARDVKTELLGESEEVMVKAKKIRMKL